mmetsp:Transcript_37/g.87  ORF Transcript_37/g.87 Transcript_37/m.87 type:complete len:475 (+) Transcript_37:289-1713(+)
MQSSSLLMALHARSSRTTTRTVLLIIIVSLTASLHVDLVRVEGLDWVDVRHCVNFNILLVLCPLGCVQRWRQQFCHGHLIVWRQRIRKLNGEDQEKVAMHKRVLVGWHALILDSLHHPEGLLGVRIRDDVHGAAPSGLLCRQCLLTGALLEVGALSINHKAAHINALTLQLRLASLFERVNISGICLRNVLHRWAICVFDDFPLSLALLLRQGIEALRHRLYNLTWLCLDQKLSAIKVGQLHLEAAQGLDQGDFSLHIKIGTFALEVSMFLLLQHEDDIAGVSIRMLISHLSEGDLVAIRRALLNVHFQHLTLLLGLEALALTTARVALRLHLLNHRPHADYLDLHATAVTFAALLDTLFLVDNLAGDGHLLGVATVHLLQRDLEVLHHVLGLLSLPGSTAAAAASTEEGLEDVPRVTPAIVLQALLAKAVILRSLVRVAKDLVGSGDLLELLGVAALVGVVLHGKFPVGLLDV